ncbi:MAG: tetratricopeptide repeat protein [Bacteroidetes bacterium]|nr:MAG: tetratricopeptide repeat protein [Bacteroidota bacterium]
MRSNKIQNYEHANIRMTNDEGKTVRLFDCSVVRMFVLTLFFLFFSFFASAQQSKIDSLLSLLKKDKEDTNKVNHLNAISQEYIIIREHDTGLKYGNQALALCDQLLSSEKILNPKPVVSGSESSLILNKKSVSYNNIGLIYKNQDNYPDALKNHFASLKIREEIGNKKGIAMSYNNIGIIYLNQGNYSDALKNFFASLKIKEEIGDKKGAASSYNNIGLIYKNQGNYPDALKNFFTSLQIEEEIGNKSGIAMSYNNIGIIYLNQGNYSDALKNFFASLKIREEIGDKLGIAMSYNNIGLIYLDQGNYPDALKNFFASLKIKEEIGDKKGIVASYNNIGSIFTAQKKFKEAEQHLSKARDLAQELGHKIYLRDAYKGLSELDSAMGNYKSEIINYKLYIFYRDSLDNDETRKTTIQQSMTYEFEKKEAATKSEQDKKDLLAAEESRREKVIRYSVSGGLLLVIVFSGFIFRSLHTTRKQKNIIEVQKTEVEKAMYVIKEQKQIVEEKSKEITDSIVYAKRIQYALLASDSYLKKHLAKDYFVLFKPKDIVSGDFYWATKKGNKFYLAVCDSTGHGVPGAFMCLLNISFLNEAINEKQIEHPNEIFNYVRKRLIQNISQDGAQDGMDGILVCFDKDNNSITYAAANNAPVLIGNNEPQHLDLDKMPIGKGEKQDSFTIHPISFTQGDMLYLYTDGYADQFGGPKGKKFKYKQLEEKLLAINDKPMNEQKNILEKTFEEWKGNLEQVDDVLVIGIKI